MDLIRVANGAAWAEPAGKREAQRTEANGVNSISRVMKPLYRHIQVRP